ncbi:MAG: hypothetical protein IJM09_03500 [Neisseriaceae bacterium]|nr:hypothetical protein [Neisseriaceae bacterium]
MCFKFSGSLNHTNNSKSPVKLDFSTTHYFLLHEKYFIKQQVNIIRFSIKKRKTAEL